MVDMANHYKLLQHDHLHWHDFQGLTLDCCQYTRIWNACGGMADSTGNIAYGCVFQLLSSIYP